jgi:holo-[acyl-carrier protein] synthase
VALSISYTHDVAVANAVPMTDEVRPRKEERPDPKEELRASFRAARSVIDELERVEEQREYETEYENEDGQGEPAE